MVRRCKNHAGTSPTMRLTVEDQESGEIFQRDYTITYKKDVFGDSFERTSVTPADVRMFIRELLFIDSSL